MDDYKPILLEQLSVLEKHERQAKNPFKARAYSKVIKGIQGLPSPITRPETVYALEGVGEKIKLKIAEIFETGKLHQAEEVKEDSGYDITNELLKIYGVGPAKAESLVRDHGIRSLDALREKPELLNDKQQVGLKYYDEFNERIPRKEMKKHEKLLKAALREVDARFEGEIVGSFRREAPDSGDIDLLVKLPASVGLAEAQEIFQRLIQYLYAGINYITDSLAMGSKKFMGVCRLKPTRASATKHRRLDILLTPEAEYPYALVYFTGADTFNVGMRKIALEQGYTMNEHGMTLVAGAGTGAKGPVPPMMTEKDIFAFLGLAYLSPKQRVNESSLKPLKK